MVATDNGKVDGRELEPEEMIPMGRERYARIEDAIHQHRKVNHSPYKLPPSLAPSYHATVIDATRLSVPYNSIFEGLERHSEPENGYILVDVNSTTPNPSEVPPYTNYIHQNGRVIMCLHNYKTDDLTAKEGALKWTDIMAASCVAAMSISGRPANMDGITSIWRISVKNTQTEKIINKLRDIYRPTGDYFEITPAADDLFFALLESDHGRAVAGLLREYPWMFGFKTITSATVFLSKGDEFPSLYWRLEPVAERPLPELGSSPSKKQARKHKKMLSRASIDSST
ncbi:hypothetical protein H9Q69_012787 [Fusarium xylarioides]|nr:hypothetical protein H9Q70_013292 [Fusarium xylarioides]KAG5770541.1 hypothetical protein H9Q73_013139 [Fusarium xylarioides]KAG5788144.1 hypothetical protein H9Q69_012787 [Fusarium xylarioides]